MLRITFEKSPASNKGIALFVVATIDGKQMKGILDVASFFDSLRHQGPLPIFTCECGSFDCGGYYIGVSHDEESVIWRNSYSPEKLPDGSEPIDQFAYSFTSTALHEAGQQIIRVLNDIRKSYPGYEIYSGTYGPNISKKEYSPYLHNDCICITLEPIDGFRSLSEFERFQDYIRGLNESGDLQEVHVETR